MPLAQIDHVPSRRVLYFDVDQLNTPRAARDQSGNVVWRWESDAFGSTAPTANAGVVVNLRFPGQYYDQESGLDYNQNRDYDPSSGRYVESDPIGLRGGVNTYAYVNGNPLGYIDSLGLDRLSPAQISAISGGIGGGVGGMIAGAAAGAEAGPAMAIAGAIGGAISGAGAGFGAGAASNTIGGVAAGAIAGAPGGLTGMVAGAVGGEATVVSGGGSIGGAAGGAVGGFGTPAGIIGGAVGGFVGGFVEQVLTVYSNHNSGGGGKCN